MPELPVKIYSPESLIAEPKRLLREMWNELIGSRELAWALFLRDFKALFRQSALGYVWLFVTPLMTTTLWFLLNSSGVINVADTGMPYPAFVLIGSLLWEAFQQSLNTPLQKLQESKAMLVKLNFSRLAPILAGFYDTCLQSIVRLILLVPVFLFVDLNWTWTILLFPVGYFALMLLGGALGLLLAPIGMLYNDVARAIGMVLRLGMYATPVVYPIGAVGLIGFLNTINPVTYLLSLTRALLTGAPIDPGIIPLSLAVLAGSLIIGFIAWVMFQLTLPYIIERQGM